MTILVTGATGNVGRPLVAQLLADGHGVRALTRDPASANLPSSVEAVKGELTDAASLTAAFDGVMTAHMINFNGVDGSPLTNGDEIMAVAKAAGTSRVTVLKGELTKSPLEEAVEASGLEWTALAPGEFMSNALDWADSIRTEGVAREGFGSFRSAMVHDADIAAVAAAALTRSGHSGKQYMVTGPESLTHGEKVRIISQVLGREITYIEMTKEEAIAKWRGCGYSEEYVAFFLDLMENPVEEATVPQPTVELVTGKPARPFAQWVRENAAAFS
ncbi:NAD(P)H-binding protein [Kibdelosporangium philippinense]|uniref:NAD(P)H-binding protein n=1 Tax=Kibdelosporangium philippinense TaxID=211113 RepID=A0ABS8ZRR1_9PSEU|nr:NAD(P)H-binding protein [Kibdelosporangium philippinense]MCE7010433.1 NAD(P)H-binding protein [Kibdelosporangium philippinense]